MYKRQKRARPIRQKWNAKTGSDSAYASGNQKYNQTLIIITHDENIALQANRILAIEDGRITRDEVISR